MAANLISVLAEESYTSSALVFSSLLMTNATDPFTVDITTWQYLLHYPMKKSSCYLPGLRKCLLYWYSNMLGYRTGCVTLSDQTFSRRFYSEFK